MLNNFSQKTIEILGPSTYATEKYCPLDLLLIRAEARHTAGGLAGGVARASASGYPTSILGGSTAALRTLMRAATHSAALRKALACGESGLAIEIGTPRSPLWPIDASKGSESLHSLN